MHLWIQVWDVVRRLCYSYYVILQISNSASSKIAGVACSMKGRHKVRCEWCWFRNAMMERLKTGHSGPKCSKKMKSQYYVRPATILLATCHYGTKRTLFCTISQKFLIINVVNKCLIRFLYKIRFILIEHHHYHPPLIHTFHQTHKNAKLYEVIT